MHLFLLIKNSTKYNTSLYSTACILSIGGGAIRVGEAQAFPKLEE
jgi:hypothetical protein